MRKNLISVIVGGAILVASSMASAHVDVGIGIGIPGPVFVPAQPVYEAPPPIVYAPAPVAAYGYADDWRERQEWRERQWRHHEHERERRERRGWVELTDARVLHAQSGKRCRWRHARCPEIDAPGSRPARTVQAPAAFALGRQRCAVHRRVITYRV